MERKKKTQIIGDIFLDVLFPRFCLGCHKEGTYLCEDCKAILDISQHRYCLCDSYPKRLFLKEKKGKCQRCNKKSLDGLYFAVSYKEKSLTRKLIHLFKYPPYYVKDLALNLSSLIKDHFLLTEENIEDIFKNSVLIPIPLDNKKLRQRGYNQTEELAKHISEITGAPVLNNVLIKTKETPAQMDLPKQEREENLKEAFICKNKDLIQDKKVLLIDDVYTTGSTMETCSLILKDAGTKEVWGLVVARD